MLTMIEKELNLLLPQRCPLCRRHSGERGLCDACWRQLSFIELPFYQRRGRLLPHALPENICVGCHAAPPPLATARATFVYDDRSRQLVLRFKHGDGLHLTPLLATFLRPHFEHSPCWRQSRCTQHTIQSGVIIRRANWHGHYAEHHLVML